MAEFEPKDIMNQLLGYIHDSIILNGGEEGAVGLKNEDKYISFLNPGIPFLEDSFDYAIDGFGAGYRDKKVAPPEENNSDPKKSMNKALSPSGENSEAAQASRKKGPEEVAAEVRLKYQSAETFSYLCDLIPNAAQLDASGTFHALPQRRLSEEYALALEMSEIYNTEPSKKNERKLKRYLKAISKETKLIDIDLLDELREQAEDIGKDPDEVEIPYITTLKPSRLVKRYDQYQKEYFKAAIQYNSLRIAALGDQNPQAKHKFAINGQLYQMLRDSALDAWKSLGGKEKVEGITARIDKLSSSGFVRIHQGLKTKFYNSMLSSPTSGANFIYAAPAPADFARSTAWTKYSFTSSEYRNKYSRSFTETEANGGFNLGLFSIGGGGKKTRSKSSRKIKSENFSITFELARIPVYRPGVSLSYLNGSQGNWRYKQDVPSLKNRLLSDGKFPPEDENNVSVPAYIHECIFIRNLNLNFGEFNSQFESEMDQIGGTGGISYGPFFAGGTHYQSKQDRDYKSTSSTEGVSIEGMQLLAFICAKVNKSPNPSPDISEDSWI